MVSSKRRANLVRSKLKLHRLKREVSSKRRAYLVRPKLKLHQLKHDGIFGLHWSRSEPECSLEAQFTLIARFSSVGLAIQMQRKEQHHFKLVRQTSNGAKNRQVARRMKDRKCGRSVGRCQDNILAAVWCTESSQADHVCEIRSNARCLENAEPNRIDTVRDQSVHLQYHV